MLSRSARLALVAALAALVAPASATGEAVTLQADAQHSGFVERGGPSLPLRRAWVADLDAQVGYPVVAEGKAFVVTAPSLGGRPRLVALRMRDGRQLWTRDLGGTSPPTFAALAYDAGKLFVTRDVYPSPDESALLALAPQDGRVLWQSGNDLTLFSAVPPVAADGVVYLSETGGGTGGVSAWRQSDGASLWRVPTEHGGGGSPALAGDVVLTQVGCEPVLFRVRRDGTPLGPTSSGCTSGHGGTPVVDGASALLHGDAHLQGSYDVASGERRSALHSNYAPAVANGTTLTADARIPGEPLGRGHTLVATRGGKVVWRFRGDGYLDSAPLVAGRTAFVGSGSGRVFGVDLRTGRRRASADAGGPIPVFDDGDRLPTGLAAAEGALLVPARGRLVAFR